MAQLPDTDFRDWLENLANTNEGRRVIIVDLLRHKGEDHMTGDDVADCRKALEWLDEGKVPNRPGPKTVLPSLVEVEVEH